MIRPPFKKLWTVSGDGALAVWRVGPLRIFRRIEIQRWAAGRHLERRVEYGILLGTTDEAPAIAVSRIYVNGERVHGEAR